MAHQKNFSVSSFLYFPTVSGYIKHMNRIVIDPDICNGQPIVRGTRVTAQTILEFLAAGDSVADILDGFPSLEKDDVLACLEFSSALN